MTELLNLFPECYIVFRGKAQGKENLCHFVTELVFLCYLCFMSNSYIFVGVFFCPHVCLVYLTCCFSSTLIVLLTVFLGLYLNIWLASTHVHLDFALSVNYRNLCTQVIFFIFSGLFFPCSKSEKKLDPGICSIVQDDQSQVTCVN